MPQGGPNERLRAIYLAELQDHMRSAEDDLLALERETDPQARVARYTSLFRAVHSLKGASRVVGEATLEAICHRLEDVFERLRGGELEASPQLFQLLLAAVDGIRQVGADEAAPGVAAAVEALIPRLDRAAEGLAPGVGPDPGLPPPAAEPPRTGGDGFVRVPAAKLDLLLSRSEQLLAARWRSASQHAELTALQVSVQSWRRRSSDVQRGLAAAAVGEGIAGARTDGERSAQRALADHEAEQRRLAQDLQAFADRLASHRRAVDRAADDLDREIRRLRLFPFAIACEGLSRAARDLAALGGKDVRVLIEGSDLELDRSILEALRDPLLHLVRNAVDHGVEPTADRIAAGKPPTATVTVTARLQDMLVEIEVSDDGRGIDPDAVSAAARDRGLAAGRSPESLEDLIFESGFSTASTVTEVSGRGFGLDVVRSRVEAMRGAVAVSSHPGQGASFRLTLPLTLTTIRALLVSVAGQTFALDTADIRRLLRADPEAVRPVEGRLVLKGHGTPVVFVSLARQLGLADGASPAGEEKAPVVLLSGDGGEAAFAVDELLAEQDVLVRSLGPRLQRVPYATGATALADGRIALILSADDLVKAALAAPGKDAVRKAAAAPRSAKRLLLADDSLTTRTLIKTILEGSGYEVTAVADGAAAWRLLQHGGADLVVTDVEMPHMDGIALTEAIRATPRLRDVPVILVTALESESDRARGLQAGASAYLTKSAFDQRELLEAVEQLL